MAHGRAPETGDPAFSAGGRRGSFSLVSLPAWPVPSACPAVPRFPCLPPWLEAAVRPTSVYVAASGPQNHISLSAYMKPIPGLWALSSFTV